MILTGWKQISKHLGFATRTLQRWEKEGGLPVTRVNSSPRSPVVADSEQLDAWMLRGKVPSGAPRSLMLNLQRARELKQEVARNRKALQNALATLRKELADFRARRRSSAKPSQS